MTSWIDPFGLANLACCAPRKGLLQAWTSVDEARNAQLPRNRLMLSDDETVLRRQPSVTPRRRSAARSPPSPRRGRR